MAEGEGERGGRGGGGSESMTLSRQGQVIITQTDLARSFIEENGE